MVFLMMGSYFQQPQKNKSKSSRQKQVSEGGRMWQNFFFLEFTSRFRLGSSLCSKKTCENEHERYTVTTTHTPPADSHRYENLDCFGAVYLDRNSKLNTAGQFKRMLTWWRNSQVWCRAVGTVGECYSEKHDKLEVKASVDIDRYP